MLIRYQGREFDLDFHSNRDHIATVVAETGTFYEIDLLAYAAYVCGGHAGTAVDVGANVGNHSVFFGNFLSEHVVAIEPNPVALPYLEKNLKRCVQSYRIVRCAVSDRNSVGSMSAPEDSDFNLGMARVIEGGDSQISICTLDEVIRGLCAAGEIRQPITLIKLDIEGMELAALHGASETISRYHPHLLVEVQEPDRSMPALSEFLRDLGYAPITKWGHTPVYHFSRRPTKDRARMVWYRTNRTLHRLMRSLRT